MATGGQLELTVAMMAIGAMTAEHQKVSATAPKLASIRFQTSSFGKAVPLVWGTARVPMNLIWYGDFTAIAHTESQTSGGKGGGNTTTSEQTVYSYTAGIAMALSGTQLASIPTVWVGKSMTTPADLGFTTFLGTWAQTAWSHLSTNHPDEALAYRGIAYLAKADYDLGQTGELANHNFEVSTADRLGTTGQVGKTFSATVSYALRDSWSEDNPFRLFNGQLVTPTDVGSLPGPLSVGTHYYVVNVRAGSGLDAGTNYFDLSATEGGAPITILVASGTAFELECVVYEDGQQQLTYEMVESVFVASAIASTAHGFAEGTRVLLTTSGTLSAPLAINTIYCVVSPTTDALQFSATPGGEPIVLTSAGTGTHTATPLLLDANPATVITDFLTNAKYGVAPGFPLASLTQLSNYCIASGTLISPALVDQEQASAILSRWAQLCNCGLVFSENVLKFSPYFGASITGNGTTFTPSVTAIYALDDDDFLVDGENDPVQVERVDNADAFNRVQIKFSDRANQYNESIAEVSDQAAIDSYGERPMSPLALPEVTTGALATWIANLVLMRAQNVRCRYTFKLPMQYLLIEPMDALTLTEASGDGLIGVTVRVIETEEDPDTGEITIIAEDFPEGSSSGVQYTHQVAGGYAANYNLQPGTAMPPILFIEPYSRSQTWLRLSIGLCGGANFGGCEIWISDDETTYRYLGKFNGNSRMGSLSTALPYHADPDNDSTASVDLTISAGELDSGTQQDANAGNTECLLSTGEIISYTTATVTAANKYDLTGLRRGRRGSDIVHAPAGTRFLRLDDALASFDFPHIDDGRRVFLKFLAFNPYGSARQSLADVLPYAYTLTQRYTGVPTPYQVSGLELSGQGVDREFAGRDALFDWRYKSGEYFHELGSEPFGADSSGRDPYFKDYLVEIVNPDGTLRRRDTASTNHYRYTYEMNAADGGGVAARTFTAIVYERNIWGKAGEAASITVTNPEAVIGEPSATGTYYGFALDYTRPSDVDWHELRIYASENAGFTADDSTLVYHGSDIPAVVTGLKSGTLYYYGTRAADVFGAAAIANVDRVTTLKSVFQSVDDTGLGTLITLAGGNKVCLRKYDITEYPPQLPAALQVSLSMQVANGVGAEVLNLYMYFLAYTSKPTTGGTLTSHTQVGATNVYNVIGSGTTFLHLEAGDFYFLGQSLMQVISITDETHMQVKQALVPTTAISFGHSPFLPTYYRGALTAFSPVSASRSLASGAVQDVSVAGAASLTDSSPIGLLPMVFADTDGAVAVTCNDALIKVKWTIGA